MPVLVLLGQDAYTYTHSTKNTAGVSKLLAIILTSKFLKSLKVIKYLPQFLKLSKNCLNSTHADKISIMCLILIALLSESMFYLKTLKMFVSLVSAIPCLGIFPKEKIK